MIETEVLASTLFWCNIYIHKIRHDHHRSINLVMSIQVKMFICIQIYRKWWRWTTAFGHLRHKCVINTVKSATCHVFLDICNHIWFWTNNNFIIIIIVSLATSYISMHLSARFARKNISIRWYLCHNCVQCSLKHITQMMDDR